MEVRNEFATEPAICKHHNPAFHIKHNGGTLGSLHDKLQKEDGWNCYKVWHIFTAGARCYCLQKQHPIPVVITLYIQEYTCWVEHNITWHGLCTLPNNINTPSFPTLISHSFRSTQQQYSGVVLGRHFSVFPVVGTCSLRCKLESRQQYSGVVLGRHFSVLPDLSSLWHAMLIYILCSSPCVFFLHCLNLWQGDSVLWRQYFGVVLGRHFLVLLDLLEH
jgi:hypothetical protein